MPKLKVDLNESDCRKLEKALYPGVGTTVKRSWSTQYRKDTAKDLERALLTRGMTVQAMDSNYKVRVVGEPSALAYLRATIEAEAFPWLKGQ